MCFFLFVGFVLAELNVRGFRFWGVLQTKKSAFCALCVWPKASIAGDEAKVAALFAYEVVCFARRVSVRFVGVQDAHRRHGISVRFGQEVWRGEVTGQCGAIDIIV